MSVNGIPPILAHLAASPLAAPRRSGEAKPADSAPAAAREPEAGATGAARAGAETRPAALRAATLWDLLTDDERAFFSDPETLSSLTYRPGRRAPGIAGTATGRRVDLEA